MVPQDRRLTVRRRVHNGDMTEYEGVVASSRPPQIRMFGDRRMQCKDIPDHVFLGAMLRTLAVDGTLKPTSWRMRWHVHAELEQTIGFVPENLMLAKARKLMAAGKMHGCPCGCRGDYHLPCEGGC